MARPMVAQSPKVPLKIVIDARWYGLENTGIGRYCIELVEALQDLDIINTYIVLLLPKYFETWRPRSKNFSAALSRAPIYSWEEQILLPLELARLKPDLVHFTSFNVPLAYQGKFVTTVHDLTLVHYKNNKGAGIKKTIYDGKYLAMTAVLKAAVTKSNQIIVPTEYTKNDLIKIYPDAHGRIEVTNEAVTVRTAAPMEIASLGVLKPFILYVGNYYVYKNIERLISAFHQSQAYKDGVQLVLNGRREHFQESARLQVEKLGLTKAIIFPGFTSDEQLAGLYDKALFFIFPSLSEGFGLPGLEAMTLGTPVLAANATCLPEVYGEAAQYFNPNSIRDMTRAIDALYHDEAGRTALSKMGYLQIQKYSWERMARQTIDIYNSAVINER